MIDELITRRLPLSRRAVLRAAGGTALAVSAAGLTLAGTRTATARATQRPISDFLAAQGTTVDAFPPFGGGADYTSWFSSFSSPPVLLAGVDYAGLEDAYLGGVLGTSFGGKVTERPLEDGRAEVLVVLHSRNALAWVTTFFEGTPLFGSFAQDVAAGAEPAVGDSHLQWTFINTAPGAPLPDFFAAILLGATPEGFEQISVSFRASASGPLREAAGSPEGTPGHLTVSQTCNGATADGCPAELVELRVVGR